jgi:hypothetical protein
MVRFAVTLLVALGANSAIRAQNQPQPDEVLAGALMRSGLLCARVVDKRQSEGADQLEVTCIEYRGGTGRVRYILDLSTGKASKAQ